MKKLILIAIGILITTTAHPITNKELRSIMNKGTASIRDGIYLLTTMNDEDATDDNLDYAVGFGGKTLNPGADLTIGLFSRMVLEMGYVKKGFMYGLTGFKRYAVDNLQYRGIVPDDFVGNRKVSGKELIELYTLLKQYIEE